MAYDTALAIFSPDGRLLQVERAQEASEQGTLVTFSGHAQGEEPHILVAIEKRIGNKMLIEEEQTKLILIDPVQNIYMSYSGLSPDSFVIEYQARLICSSYKLNTSENIDLETLAYKLSMVKHGYTIEGGKRPFGIRTILMGFDSINNTVIPRVFIVEPDGNCSEYYKGAIGMKSGDAITYLQDNAECTALDGILNVVNNDYNKVVCFKIRPDMVERLDDEAVKTVVQQRIEKEARDA